MFDLAFFNVFSWSEIVTGAFWGAVAVLLIYIILFNDPMDDDEEIY